MQLCLSAHIEPCLLALCAQMLPVCLWSRGPFLPNHPFGKRGEWLEKQELGDLERKAGVYLKPSAPASVAEDLAKMNWLDKVSGSVG